MNRPSPEDMKAMQVMKYVEKLEKENKRLKATNEILNKWKHKLSEDINKLVEKREIGSAIIAEALIDLCEAIEEYLDNTQTDE